MLEFVNGTLAVLDQNTVTPYFQVRTTIAGSAGTSVDVVDLDRVTYLQRPEDTGHRRVDPAEPEFGFFHEVMPGQTWQSPGSTRPKRPGATWTSWRRSPPPYGVASPASPRSGTDTKTCWRLRPSPAA